MHQIYNFDHGFTTACKFSIGKYTIQVKNEHLDTSILAKNKSYSYPWGLDNDGRPARKGVVIEGARPGRWAPTAEIEDHEDLHGVPKLLANVPARTALNDVELVFSFLTGRKVVIGNGAQQTFWLEAGENLVSDYFFQYSYQFDWEMTAYSESQRVACACAMDAVCNAMHSSDILTKIALGSAALDRLSGSWHGEKVVTPDERINKKFEIAAGCFVASLRRQAVPESLLQDITPRIQNLLGVSAVTKLQAFLQAQDMLPKELTPESKKRVKLFNSYRNAVVHSADVSLRPHKPFEDNARVAGAISLLILMICRVYIASTLLQIRNDKLGVEQDRKTVLLFFQTGNFRGHDVFNESFEKFMNRIENQWINEGKF